MKQKYVLIAIVYDLLKNREVQLVLKSVQLNFVVNIFCHCDSIINFSANSYTYHIANLSCKKL